MATPTEELYKNLYQAFDFFNERLFDGGLSPVVFTIDNSPRFLGYFSADRWISRKGDIVHQISMNSTHFGADPLILTLSTLVHEQVHHWQRMYGRPGRRGYHNQEWAEKMKEVGLQPTNFKGGETGDRCGDTIIAGGPFINLCGELIRDKGFDLAWTDRELAVPQTVRMVEGSPLTQGEGVRCTEAEAAAELDRRTQLAQSEALELLGDSHGLEPEVVDLLATPMSLLLDDRQLIRATALKKVTGQPRKAPTRHKYVCPGCEVSAQARPRVRMACIACNTEFYDAHRLPDALRALGLSATEYQTMLDATPGIHGVMCELIAEAEVGNEAALLDHWAERCNDLGVRLTA